MSARDNGRSILRALGIGSFNATMIIQYLFIAPATTDPRSPPIIMLVKHVQQALVRAGLRVNPSGYLDPQTANALERVCGPGWEQRPWADVVQAVLRAMTSGQTYADDPTPITRSGPGMALGAIKPRTSLGFVSLPDVPGGIVTYALAAAVGYHFWKRR